MIKQKTTTKNNNEKLLTNIKHIGPLSKTSLEHYITVMLFG